jgi:CBS domain-containing protein
MGIALVGLEPETCIDAEWSHRVPVTRRMTGAGDVVAVEPDTSCAAADELARARGLRHLLVVDGDRLEGVLCVCDLHDHREREDLPVREIMTTEVLALDEDASLAAAAQAMREHHVGVLPVVRGSALAGVISRGDLRRAGMPETLLGASQCTNCGSLKAVRAGPHSNDFCLDCIDLLDGEITEADYGEGD